MIPSFLIDKLNSYYNETEVKEILNGYKINRIVSLRVNTIKENTDNIKKVLNDNNILFKEVSWYKEAFIIENVNEEKIRELDIYKEGKIYLQSLSSMIPPLILNPQENELILDMAAAPGGKTTQIAALTNNKAMITAIEKNKIRASKLKYNLELQGTKKVSLLVSDASKLDEYFMFDKILLDAPCSGSGTLIDNNINEKYFNINLINISVERQKRLIEEAIKHLKINGTLVYSTCSILKEENEEIIKYILNKYNNIKLDYIDYNKYKDIPILSSELEGTLTILPNKYYEGFFVAKLIRIK